MKTAAFPPGPNTLKALSIYVSEGFNLLRLLRHIVRGYGDIVHLRLFGRNHYIVNHPDYIEKVLLAGYDMRRSTPQPLRQALGKGLITSQGDLHKTMRRHMQPFFSRQRIQDMSGMFVRMAEQKMSGWKDGETRDIAEEMIHLMLSVILQTLLGSDFRDEIRSIGKSAYLIHLNMNQNIPSNLNILKERIPRLGSFTELGRARKHMDRVIFEAMEKRRREKNFEGQDLLSLLLNLQAKGGESGHEITDEQIRDEIITMFMAGHETISNAISWTWYLLSLHPGVYEKVRAEVDAATGGARPSYEHLSKLEYTRMVFSETMRLYPPVWCVSRRTVPPEMKLGDYVIPEGSIILLSQYLVHRDERFWPDPERFDPERFRAEEEDKRPKFAYFPFGAGNRKCIGDSMAWVEGLLIVAAIAQRWTFKFVAGHPIELEPLISLKPKHGIRMILEKRNRPESSDKETASPAFARPSLDPVRS